MIEPKFIQRENSLSIHIETEEIGQDVKIKVSYVALDAFDCNKDR